MVPALKLIEPDFSPIEVQIRAWIKENRAHLKELNNGELAPGEVAWWAVKCGFELEDVCRVLSDFTDAIQGSSIDNRAKFEVWRFEMVVHKRQPAILDLTEQWKSLAAKSTIQEP